MVEAAASAAMPAARWRKSRRRSVTADKAQLIARMNAPSTHWHGRIADRLIEPFGKALDALGCRVEGRDHRRLRRLAAIRRDHARLLQLGELGLKPGQLLLHLR